VKLQEKQETVHSIAYLHTKNLLRRKPSFKEFEDEVAFRLHLREMIALAMLRIHVHSQGIASYFIDVRRAVFTEIRVCL